MFLKALLIWILNISAINASLALVQPEHRNSGKCQMLMFWLLSIFACVLFYRECAWVCVSCMTSSVCVCMRERVCVLSCGMLQGHVHGPVPWWCHVASLFLSSPPFSLLGQPAGNHLRCLIIFITTKTSKIGGFLWKKTCPRNSVACWKIYICFVFLSFFSLFFSTVFLG